MKFNWDFIRGQKTRLEPPAPPTGDKMITVNGHAHEIQGAHLDDMQVAGRVRMLMRTDLDHESVCTLARDRIVYLSDRLAELSSHLGAVLLELDAEFSTVAETPIRDSDHHDEVAALGKRIGFGALMSSAERGWRDQLEHEGYPVGGEFIAGPSRVTLNACLRKIRAAIGSIGERP